MLNFIVNRFDLSGTSAIYSKLLDRMYGQKVLFVHVPKCGGTSLSHTLRARYALSYFKLSEEASTAACPGMSPGAWMRCKRDLVAYHAHAGAHFVQAHVSVDGDFLDTHFGDFRKITLLRNPVERVVSHYFFDPRLRSMTPEQFLESPRGFVETRVLCHFFGGLDWDEPGSVEKAEAEAVATLERFDVVGVLERPEAFHRALAERAGLGLALPRRNVGTNREERTFSAETIARIREMCASDLRIYDRYLQAAASAEAL